MASRVAERPRAPEAIHRKQTPLAGMVRPHTLVFVLLLLAGLALRILIARTTWHQPDSDEATGMILALQASRGHLSLVFWGGNYGGTLVSWIEAPLVLLFGLRLWLFWVVDTVLTLVGVLIFRAICRRILPPVAASATAGAFWFFPAAWIFWSGREYEFWLPAIVFALATCLLVFRWTERHGRSDLYLLGLFAGLAVWSYPLVASMIIPALVIFVWVERTRLLNVARAAGAALIGVSPWLAFFALHGRSAFTVQQTGTGYFAPLRHSVTQVLPAALFGGQKRSDVIWATPLLGPHQAQAVGLLIMVAAAVLAATSFMVRRVDLAAGAASVLLWPPLLALGHVPVSAATFRYGFIALPPLLVLAGYLASLVRAGLLLAGLTLLSSTWIAVSDTADLASAPGCNATVRTVDRWLVDHDRTAVWASYWLAGTMEVCGAPNITASAVAPQRDHAAASAAEHAPSSTYVVFGGQSLDSQLSAWQQTHPGVAEKAVVAGYAVYTFSQPVEPAQLHLVGSAF